MNRLRSPLATTGGLALFATLLATPFAAQEAPAQGAPALEAYLPGDVFFASSRRPNEERAFLDAYWDGVWEAVEDSGLVEELSAMAMQEMKGSMGAGAEQAETEIRGLVEAVDWASLFGGSCTSAQRWATPVASEQQVSLPMPEWVVLSRSAAEPAQKNFEVLTGIVQAVAAKIGGDLRVDLEVRTLEEGGTKLVVVDLLQLADRAAPLELGIGLRGDVLLLSLGATLRQDVLERMGDGGASLATDARFREALEGLPAPEDGFHFFDVSRFLPGLVANIDFVRALMGVQAARTDEDGEPVVDPERQLMDGLLDEVVGIAGMFDYSVGVRYTEGTSTHLQSVTRLAGGAKSHPLYPTLASVHSFDSFARFVPKDSSAFNVQGGPDMLLAWDYIEGLFGRLGPLGQKILVDMEEAQEGFGIDLREEVFGLLGGQSVSATFERDGAQEWVQMMAVKKQEEVAKHLEYVLEQIPVLMGEMASQNPMMGMMIPQIAPTQGLDGFHDLNMAMMGGKVVVGVRDGFLTIASSAGAVNSVEATMRGEAPSVLDNERLAGLALFPEGMATAVTFADKRTMGEEVAGALAAVQMMGGMAVAQMPPEGRELATRLMALAGSLAPVAQAVDFYDSTASATLFDGQGWKTHAVTNYRKPRAATGQ